MKRTLIVAAVAAFALSLISSAAMAQAPRPAEPPREGAAPPPPPQRPFAELLGDLKLTDDQQAQLKAIADQLQADMPKAEGEQAKREARQAAVKKIVDNVLTDEQRKAVQARQAKAQAGPFAGLENLTDAQKEQIKAIMDQAKADAEKAAREIMDAAQKKVAETVLTDEQRKAVAARKPAGEGPLARLAALNLTEDQKAQIKAIQEQAKADAKAADNEQARREIMQAAEKKIAETVLTDEQRGQLRKAAADRPEGKRPAPEGDRPAPPVGGNPK
jgi:Spy/CpxP family protein refolding chaperone